MSNSKPKCTSIDKTEECSICQELLVADDNYLPSCIFGHMFHTHCLLERFERNEDVCPVCQTEIEMNDDYSGYPDHTSKSSKKIADNLQEKKIYFLEEMIIKLEDRVEKAERAAQDAQKIAHESKAAAQRAQKTAKTVEGAVKKLHDSSGNKNIQMKFGKREEIVPENKQIEEAPEYNLSEILDNIQELKVHLDKAETKSKICEIKMWNAQQKAQELEVQFEESKEKVREALKRAQRAEERARIAENKVKKAMEREQKIKVENAELRAKIAEEEARKALKRETQLFYFDSD